MLYFKDEVFIDMKTASFSFNDFDLVVGTLDAEEMKKNCAEG